MPREALSRPSFVESVAPQTISNRLDVEAKLARGLGLVVARAVERGEYQQSLSVGQRHSGGYVDRRRTAGLDRLNVRRKMTRFDPTGPRNDHGALDDITQLANVARPRVRLQQRARRVVHTFDRHAVLPAEFANEVSGQQRDIVGPLAQWRQRDLEYVEAVEQVLAKKPVADRGRNRPIRCRQHANVEMNFLASAKPARVAVFENAQKLWLERHRHFRDLVQKQRPTIRKLESTRPRAVGPGERPLLVSEQLALDETFGN